MADPQQKSFLITAPDGKQYKVTGATKEGALAALKQQLGAMQAPPSGHEAMTAKSLAAIEQAKAAGESPRLASFLQGTLQNYGDEMIGGIEAARSGFAPGTYTESRDKARAWLDAAQAERPGYGIGGGLATGIPAAVLTGGTSLPAVIGSGAGFGAVSSYGATKGNDLQAIKDVSIGTGLGATGGLAGFGLGKLLEKFLTRGLAVETIKKAMDGKPGELLVKIRQLGGSAAEADDVLREVLRGQAAKNPTAAVSAVPAAQQRLASVNAEVQQKVSDIISPDNARLLIDRLKKQAQDFASGKYGAAYATEGRVGLVKELAENPGLKPAIDAASDLAAMEGRTFDVTSLSVKDLDAMQRALRGEVDKLFKEGGTQTIFGPVKSELRDTVNDLAKAMSQDFAEVQAKYAQNAAQREAVKLGQQALNPSKEFVEVAEEFAKLSPLEQEAYRAGVATRARTILQSKVPTANAANALRPEAIIEKLKAVGFPEDQLNALIQKGTAARGVLDALQGGSDTARKLAAAAASESPLTKVKANDLAAAALVHPSTLFMLPLLRAAGAAQERKAADVIIRALTEQGGKKLEGLLRWAPQRATAPLGLLGGPLSQTARPK